MDAPAPVQYPRAILDEVHRGGDVGCDAGVGVALDDHLEAAPGIFQGAEKTAVFGVFVTCRKDGGDGGAMFVRRLGISGIDAGARLARIAVAQVIGELGGIEIHVAFDDADTHGRGLDPVPIGFQPMPVEGHRVEKAIGNPFVVARLRFFVLFERLFGAGLFDHDGVDADFVAQAQHQGIALGQVLHRQAQLVGVQRRYGTDHFGPVALGEPA